MSDEPKHIGPIIKRLIKAYRLRGNLLEQDVTKCWEEIMGKSLIKETESVMLNNGVLRVKLRSSVLRQELSYSREELVSKINQMLGEEHIKDLILS
jgi:hypothetical protein